MAQSLIVKITDGKDIRRFTASEEALTFSAISKRASDTFGLEGCAKLTYKDDEGDQITMTTNEEMQEAVRLARALNPPVLRLKIEEGKTRAASPLRGASSPREAPPPPPPPPTSDPDLQSLMKNIAEQLPALVGQLPQAVKDLIPHAELDIAATLAANAAANAATVAASAASTAANVASKAMHEGFAAAAASQAAAATAASQAVAATAASNGVHDGYTCDRSNVAPIVGMRYHLTGHNYDLCEAEFLRLPEQEQALYEKIPPPPPPPPPSSQNTAAAVGFHPGVTCDKTFQCPIVGMRYHLRGHDYDLCEAEFLKLPEQEQALYEKIAPPVGRHAGGAAEARGWRKEHAAGGGSGGWNSAPRHQKLAARFVCDLSIFDGTQMTAGTSFTKMWRIKNVGEVAWPAGTKLLFVGGDKMSAELQVPLALDGPVQPGAEVDVAVDMVAPAEQGRFVSYWRPAGPHGRKFGQRIWAHVHVVDPHAPPQPPTELEISKMMEAQSMHGAADAEDEHEATPKAAPEAEAAPAVEAPPPTPVVPAAEAEDPQLAAEEAALVASMAPSSEAPPVASTTPASAPMEQEETPAAAAVGSTEMQRVAAELVSMGFADEAAVQQVLEKNGADVDACVRDLVALGEWDMMLDAMLADLAEMGFEDRTRNTRLLMKNGGSLKKTVKELVADTA